MDKEKKVKDYIEEYGMLTNGDKVIAGVSGGADSMCMLKILMALRENLSISIIVVHINHGIRGNSADNDQRFVEDFCRENDLECISVKADILKIAKEQKLTCEEAGRNYRYETFAKTAAAYNCNRVAVAHNSDDNAETVLFNMFRGSGITGMCGIRPVRRRKTALGEITVIRPILCLSRKEIEEYLAEKGLCFCTDETNLTNDYSRNCIRNLVLPEIRKSINGNVTEHIAELSVRAREMEDYLEEEAERVICNNAEVSVSKVAISIECLEKLHNAVRSVVLRKLMILLSKSMKDIEAKHTRLLWELCNMGTGKRLDLPYDITAYNEYGRLVLRTPSGDSEAVITYSVIDYDGKGEIPKSGPEKWFDYDLIKGELKVRNRENGDYLLIGKEGHKKSLNRYFIDCKLPEAERDGVAVLAEGSHILYVAGMRRDDSYPVSEKTKRVLVVRQA